MPPSPTIILFIVGWSGRLGVLPFTHTLSWFCFCVPVPGSYNPPLLGMGPKTLILSSYRQSYHTEILISYAEIRFLSYRRTYHTEILIFYADILFTHYFLAVAPL